MWARFAFTTVILLAVIIVVLILSGHLTARYETAGAYAAHHLPASSQDKPPGELWLAGWLFVLLAAAIIVSVWGLRATLSLFDRLRNKPRR